MIEKINDNLLKKIYVQWKNEGKEEDWWFEVKHEGKLVDINVWQDEMQTLRFAVYPTYIDAQGDRTTDVRSLLQSGVLQETVP